MKYTTFLLLIFISRTLFAEDQTNDVRPEAIDIVGTENIVVDDDELKFLENELKNVKTLKQGYKKKSKVLTHLNTEAKGLSEDFSDYATKRNQYDSILAEYQEKQKCMLNKTTKDQCAKETSFLDEFNKLMAAKTSSFQLCYDKAIKKNPKVQGDVEFQLTFLPSGEIDHIGVIEGLDTQDRNMIRCIYQSILKVKFPSTGEKDKIRISKKMNFNIAEQDQVL